MIFLLACASNPQVIKVPSEHKEVFESYLKPLVDLELSIEEADPSKDSCQRGEILLIPTDLGKDCFEIESNGTCAIVKGDKLGLQYGLSTLLENMNVRFFHPYETVIPESLELPDALTLNSCPSMTRRGIHLHTLHPIEGYYDTWEPGNEDRAEKIIDWVIKNRGNFLQWVSLEDQPDSWEEHTQFVIKTAHMRGIEVGLGVQLFSNANLQKAFNLVQNDDGDLAEQMEDSWAKLTPLDFDLYNLSFGEFFDSEAELFIESIDMAYEILKEQDPDAQMSTVLHVGEDLQVPYNGEDYIYYLLAQFANPEITPWVHTVMFYNLYDSAAGAYHHEYFTDHRELIESKLEAGEPVAYFPESAYWVAFDNSVPQFLPVYVHSRWKDLHNLTGLQEHILFSSGWEWGFWLNDVMTLRMNWAVPDSYDSLLTELFEPIGDPALAPALLKLAKLQYQSLIIEELAPWTCGVDIAMEVGAGLGIIAQPPRPSFNELTTDHLNIAEALEIMSSETKILHSRISTDTPWGAEISDGMEINVLRTSFMSHLIKASVNGDNEEVSMAEDLLNQAHAIVKRRHSSLWDPQKERLITTGENSTLYQFGYLLRTEELCFWERELIQVKNLLTGTSETVPGCNL